MRKWIVWVLVIVLTTGCMACGTGTQESTGTGTQDSAGTDNQESTETESRQESQIQISEVNEILTKVWGTYKEEEKFYVEGPMRLEEAEAGYLESAFCFPAESAKNIDDVAILIHALNANTFSAAAYHVTEGTDIQALAEDIKDRTLDNQWLCGFPERLIIVTVGDEYLVTAFGKGGVVDNFKNKLLGAYDTDAELIVEENI